MKDFDRAEIGAVRKMSEANFFFDQHKSVAARQETRSRYRDRVKARSNALMMRKGEEEFV